MTRVRAINDEVFVAEDALVTVNGASIASYLDRAARNTRHRARLCAHKDNEDRIHEMFITLTGDAYIRPHRHLHKSESFHVIEGTATVVFFDEAGGVEECFDIGDYHSGLPFYYRNEDARFHTQLVTSARLVFHETTNGPFRREDTVLAPWSPVESDWPAVQAYLEKLQREVAARRRPPRAA